MEFINVTGGDVKQGMMSEAQRWLEDHEAEIAAAMPDGTEYIGTYVVAIGTEKNSGFVKTLIRMNSYGAMDALAAAGKGDGALAKLMREWQQFFDWDGNWSQEILKRVTDATIYE